MLKSLCNDDLIIYIIQQNRMTISSYCHEGVRDVQRYLWHKFQVKTINTTNVLMKYQPWAKVTPRFKIKITQA